MYHINYTIWLKVHRDEPLAIFIKRYAEFGCFLLLIIETAKIMTFDGIPSTINMNNIPILTFVTYDKSLVNASSHWSSEGPKSILDVFKPSNRLDVSKPLNFVRLMLLYDGHLDLISQMYKNCWKISNLTVLRLEYPLPYGNTNIRNKFNHWTTI